MTTAIAIADLEDAKDDARANIISTALSSCDPSPRSSNSQQEMGEREGAVHDFRSAKSLGRSSKMRADD